MLKRLNLINLLFLFFITHFSFAQEEHNVINFESTCLEVLKEYNPDQFTVDTLVFRKKYLKIVFEAEMNCMEDNMGKILVNGDTIKISDNDIKVEISKKDLVSPDGNSIEIELKTETKEYSFCVCRTRYLYELEDFSKKVRYLDFNGHIVDLKNK